MRSAFYAGGLYSEAPGARQGSRSPSIGDGSIKLQPGAVFVVLMGPGCDSG